MAHLRSIALLALLCSFSALAEEPPPPPADSDETLVSGKLESGGYGGPRATFGRIAGHDAISLGGEGGWILNHQFILGGAGYGLVTNQPAPGPFAATDYLTVGYGGGMLGYTFLPHRLVHGTITALIGAGGLGRRAHSGGDTDLNDSFFVFEPTATAELNVVSFFRIGVGVSYRFISGVETQGITNSELSGIFGSLVLKFGKF